MWIICAGGKRSGSTLQYNIISRIIEESQKGKRITYFKPDEFNEIKEKNADFKGFKVIKTHLLTPEINLEIENNNALVFHCYRDIRDVVVSCIHKGWINNNKNEIINCVNTYIIEFNDWMILNKKIHSRKYEAFAFHIYEEIEYILNILNIELDENIKYDIVNDLNLESLKKSQNNISLEKERTIFSQTFHKDTLLHTNHINDGSQNQFLKHLNESNIALIESLAYNYLLNNDYKLYWTEFDKFMSFSQHADDYIAWQLLGKKRNGIVVEVGAFDGVHLSNSFSLNQLSWKTVCIEANPKIYSYLEKNRPDSININKAIVGDVSINEIDFYSEEIGVLSGCDYDEEDIKKRYKNRGLEYNEPEKIKIKACTLNSILSDLEFSDNIIDLLSIDVEGLEFEVLKGLYLNKYEIKLFIIEANNTEAKIEILNYFKNYPIYTHIGNNGQNMFILNNKYLSKKVLRNLNFNHYIKAKQFHPKNDLLTLDSTSPNFVKTNNILKYEKYFGLF